jgi:CRISPR-associated protein (TIGR02710 family)
VGNQTGDSKILLICTVGGSPRPVVKAIEAIRPGRVIFVCSAETRVDLASPQPRIPNPRRETPPVEPEWLVLRFFGLTLAAKRRETPPDEPKWLEAPVDSNTAETVIVSDAQRIDLIIQSVHGKLDEEVHHWLGRGEGYEVVVDITGGTKAMSAALALCARQWDCQFYYTGGTQREKANVGVVRDGSEKAFATANPWEALGYQDMEEFRLFFNMGNFAAAKTLAETQKVVRLDKNLKKKFLALSTLAGAYAQWESFEHQEALRSLNDLCATYANDMGACGEAFWNMEFQEEVKQNIEQLTLLVPHGQVPTTALVFELLANAERRGSDNEGRFDDAVARLYRCTEAIAQVRLHGKYGLDSASVPLDKVPESLRAQWASHAENGKLKLGLQDDYALLAALGDDLGNTFRNLNMYGDKSPLSARNGSILAHGFQPIPKKAYSVLLEKVKELARSLGGSAANDVRFPKLGQ